MCLLEGEKDVRASQREELGHRVEASVLCIGGGKLYGHQKGQNLKKTIREKGNPFKVSSPRVPLAESINNIIELLQDQFHQGLLSKVNKELGTNPGSQENAR
ncbi:hypothetical protein GOBAR_AA25990 [Gossypium barbadense]|uniref:Uncharacterized protein n=1 Tax=Gossypium barbadense TaxID=3634 RepID=A0A2P5WUB2_GOSBA|nr:hypothetical protein GOBAR_AA25990 [Gossypium barbadense]